MKFHENYVFCQASAHLMPGEHKVLSKVNLEVKQIEVSWC